MSTIERVLSGGSAESPDCRCGSEMALAAVQASMDDSDTALRIYVCPACRHELRLMVWAETPILDLHQGNE